ncbi:MAG: hypothetical protein R2710_12225 [Acidimicrobiales bacterium]
MAADSSSGLPDGAAEGVVSTNLRQRATAIQVIGAPEVDRSAQRQQRLGASLLLALALGWDSLMVAANSTGPFHLAIGRFLLIFAVTVGTIRALGNMYDRYLDDADLQDKLARAARHRADASTNLDTDQPAT